MSSYVYEICFRLINVSKKFLSKFFMILLLVSIGFSLDDFDGNQSKAGKFFHFFKMFPTKLSVCIFLKYEKPAESQPAK